MTDQHLIAAVLQLLRVKGRAAPGMLADSLAVPTAQVSAVIDAGLANGHVAQLKDNFRLTPAGREHLAQRIAAERVSLDAAALAHVYESFHALNTEFKTVVTAWQVRNGAPNDHADAAYDRQVLAQLTDLDRRWQPVLARIVALAPRAQPYPSRFVRALERLSAGDGGWFARPIVDSYHTVWFELHEDLIGWLGLSREAEAVAGRAE